ncbi:MAG: exosortase/archaeosortase family protein, partial [Planctomycetota bacterium]
GVATILLGVVMRLAGIVASIFTLEALSLIPFVIGLVWVCFGPRVVWILSLPLGFLCFMVPIPGFIGDQLSSVLQSIATHVSVFSLQTVGIPVIPDGNIIRMPNGVIGVAEACSGIRMLFTFFALNVGFCLAVPMTWIERVVLVASAVPIAILTNCFRITLTGIAYEYVDSSMAESLFHDFAGIIMIPLGLAMAFLLKLFIKWVVVLDPAEQ